MPAKFVTVDRDTPLLLPPDLRDWIPEDDMVHFVIEAIHGMKLTQLRSNERGSGSAQYPPRMMLSLLVYCYSHGIFSSRKIERATHRDVAVRYLTGDTHPDHDTIATFRRSNSALLKECFVQVLLLAKELKILSVGTVSVDGTQVRANASKAKNVTYDRAGELIEQLELDISELLEQADRSDLVDKDRESLPKDLARREKLLAKLKEARAKGEARAQKRFEKEQKAYEEKLKAREERSVKGTEPKAPTSSPKGDKQINLTDGESRIMRKSKRSSFEQSYNAQAVVDAETMLIVGQRVSQSAVDNNELIPDIEAIPDELGKPREVLADSGYANEKSVKAMEEKGIDPYISVGSENSHRHRRYEFRAKKSERPREPKAPWRIKMKAKLESEEGQAKYQKRFHTVEPVFGIIKQVLGFRQFSVRGLEKVESEWELVSTAYNLKRLFVLQGS